MSTIVEAWHPELLAETGVGTIVAAPVLLPGRTRASSAQTQLCDVG
jgi:hypothetical protein